MLDMKFESIFFKDFWIEILRFHTLGGFLFHIFTLDFNIIAAQNIVNSAKQVF